MKDTLVIFHNMGKDKPCIDGIAAAYVTSLNLLKSETSYLGWGYGLELPNVDQYKHIYILDFTFPATVLKEWADQGKTVVVIDHHEKMMKELLSSKILDKIELNFDNLESGASLTWRYFFPDNSIPIPLFIQYIKDRDLWNHKLPDSIQINEGLYSLIKEALNDISIDPLYINMGLNKEDLRIYSVFHLFNQLKALDTQEKLSNYLLPIGADALEIKKEIIDEIVRNNISVVDLLGERILVCSYPPKHSDLRSDICSRLYTKYPKYPYVIGCCRGDINDKEDSNYYLAFRSNKNGSNFNVAEVASKFGGGGHRNASGAKVTKLPWEE